ncbi:hypothetical protein BFJ70_g9845 [Fusarium oxysporum]|nr:hypothetical protein BFJ70_g9845 [Fusarium oxysporum]
MCQSGSSNRHIAIVAPLPEDYETAKALLSEPEPEYHLSPSGAACSLGKAGPHDVVLIGKAKNMLNVSFFVKGAVTDLLKMFPFIRAGFLIGVDATTHSSSIAKAGHIVIGLPQNGQPGLIQFEADKASVFNRISTTSEMNHPPSCVQSVNHSSRSPMGQQQWQRYLDTELSRLGLTHCDGIEHSIQPSRVLGGKIASSASFLSDHALTDKIESSNKIICFERAAANLQPRLPFLTICAIASSTNSPTVSDSVIRHARVVAILYAMFVARRISIVQLEQEENFTDLFQYESFNLERPGFRLIRLSRGFKSQLKCHLFQAYLDEDDLIPYEGLSYVWGSQDTPDKIEVNGKTLAITASLHDALWHLRQTDEDRILWVDALCIDQSNIKERGHQVNHMGEIYRKADNVILWLGYLNGDAALLKSAIDRFKSQLPPQAFRQWSREDSRWKDQWVRVEDGTKEYHEKLSNGLHNFMDNAWFSRVWILQEVANAKRAIVKCNLGNIPAKVFALLPHAMNVQVNEQCQAVLDIMPGPQKGSSWWNENRNLCNLLWKFRGSQATDPRDRVYALLDLASDIKDNRIRADYAKEEKAVIRDFCGYLFGEEWRANGLPASNIAELQSKIQVISKELLLQKLDQQISTASFKILLHRQGSLSNINDTDVLKVMQHGSEKMTLFLDRSEKTVRITSETALRALSRHPEVFEVFLQRPDSPLDPEPKLILQAMKHHPETLEQIVALSPQPDLSRENALIELIAEGLPSCQPYLNHNGPHLKITTRKLRITMARHQDVLLYLLRVAQSPVPFSKNTFLEAIPNDPKGIRVLGKNFQPIPITKELIAEGIMAGSVVLQSYLDMTEHPFELEEDLFLMAIEHDRRGWITRDRITRISDGVEMVIPIRIISQPESANTSTLAPKVLATRSLLKRCNKPFDVTENVYKMAFEAGSSVYTQIFLTSLPDTGLKESKIQLFLTKHSAKQLLEALKTKPQVKLQITDKIIETAKDEETREMLVEIQRSERDVPEDAAIRAIKTGPKAFNALYNQPGTNFKVTERIFKAAREQGYALHILEAGRSSEVKDAHLALHRKKRKTYPNDWMAGLWRRP